MTKLEPIFKFDCTSAMSKGARAYQEDSFIADFSNGAESGFAVLSDGMGGHAAGDIASQIVVTEVFSELTFRRAEFQENAAKVPEMLRAAAQAANECIAAHVHGHPQTEGMGATLLVAVIVEDALYWISIGDSPLYLYRDNCLKQLNADHSLAPQIDQMVASGVLSPEEGRAHPDRSILTSVLFGEEIAETDCPPKPLDLMPGDKIIIASDGLQFLSNDSIAMILRDRPFARSSNIADALMSAVIALEDPDLDNVTLGVIQVEYTQASTQNV